MTSKPSANVPASAEGGAEQLLHPVPIPSRPARYVAEAKASARGGERRGNAKEIREGAGRVIAAYSRYCRDNSVPTPSRMDIAILSTQARNLLSGGYDERDITDEALTVASEFSLIFGHRGMTQLQRRVQQKYEDQRIQEHEDVVGPVADPEAPRANVGARRAVRVMSPQAMGAAGIAPKAPERRAPSDWRTRCKHTGCTATALYSLDVCAAHDRSAA